MVDSETYWQRKELGLCTNCAKEKKDKEARLCPKCYLIDRKAKLKYYFNNKDYIDSYRQERRELNRKMNRCDDCFKSNVESTYCSECATKRNKRTSRERKLRNEMSKPNLDFSIELRELTTHE